MVTPPVLTLRLYANAGPAQQSNGKSKSTLRRRRGRREEPSLGRRCRATSRRSESENPKNKKPPRPPRLRGALLSRLRNAKRRSGRKASAVAPPEEQPRRLQTVRTSSASKSTVAFPERPTRRAASGRTDRNASAGTIAI